MRGPQLLTSRIVPSYSGPPRRYYRITPQGRTVLAAWRAIWNETRDFVDRFTTPDQEAQAKEPQGKSP
jgi:PadR family transcriptional regulator PadR